MRLSEEREIKARRRYDIAKGFIVYLIAILVFFTLGLLVYQNNELAGIARDTRALADQAKEEGEQNRRLLQRQDDILNTLVEESNVSRDRFRQSLDALNDRVTLSEQRTREAINRLIAELNEHQREEGHRDLSFVDPVTGEPVRNRPKEEPRREPSPSPSPTPSPSPSPVCVPIPVVQVCIEREGP